VHINLTQGRVAGINESMRRVCRNDDDAPGFYVARVVTNPDCGAAFNCKGDLDVGMRV
jgi:hypothetical protein